MDYNFVLTENDEGIMAGGYIINDRLLVSSMSGGRNKKKYDDEDEDGDEDIKNKLPKYSIPAGLFYMDVPHNESSVKMMYNNATELSDDIYDSLYNNILISNSDVKNTKKLKTTKKRKKSSNKKSRKQKK